MSYDPISIQEADGLGINFKLVTTLADKRIGPTADTFDIKIYAGRYYTGSAYHPSGSGDTYVNVSHYEIYFKLKVYIPGTSTMVSAASGSNIVFTAPGSSALYNYSVSGSGSTTPTISTESSVTYNISDLDAYSLNCAVMSKQFNGVKFGWYGTLRLYSANESVLLTPTVNTVISCKVGSTTLWSYTLTQSAINNASLALSATIYGRSKVTYSTTGDGYTITATATLYGDYGSTHTLYSGIKEATKTEVSTASFSVGATPSHITQSSGPKFVSNNQSTADITRTYKGTLSKWLVNSLYVNLGGSIKVYGQYTATPVFTTEELQCAVEVSGPIYSPDVGYLIGSVVAINDLNQLYTSGLQLSYNFANQDDTITFSYSGAAVLNLCTITVKYNDGVTSDTTATAQVNSLYTLPASPTRTGYTFQGWFVGNTLITSPYTVPAQESIIINAVWQANTISVTLTDATTTRTASIIYDTAAGAVIATPPEKTGYTFDGYYSESSYTNKVTDDKCKLLSKFKVSSNTTWYAKFIAKTVTIVYMVGNTFIAESNTFTYDGTYSNVPGASYQGINKIGKKFTGWIDSGGQAITNGGTVKAVPDQYGVNRAQALYQDCISISKYSGATWEPVGEVLKYDGSQWSGLNDLLFNNIFYYLNSQWNEINNKNL